MQGMPMIKIPIALIGMIAAADAVAVDCYSRSPAFARDGDAYFVIDRPAPAPSDRQVRRLEELLERLRGDWQGDGRRDRCLGSQRAPRPDVTDYRSRLSIETPQPARLRLVEQRTDTDDRTERREVTLLSTARSGGAVRVVERRAVVLVEKYRRASRSDDAALWEVIHRLAVDGKRLRYTQTSYVNGLLAAQDVRDYER